MTRLWWKQKKTLFLFSVVFGSRSVVVWLDSFVLVSAGDVSLLLIILFGCGRRRGKLFPGVLSSGSIDSGLTRQFLTCKRRESVFTLDYPYWMWKKKRGNCFLGVCQVDRSTVVWLGSFSLVSAGKVFLLLIILFGCGRRRGKLFPGSLSSGWIDSCLTRQRFTCKRWESVFTLDFPVGAWAMDAGRRR